MSAPPMRDALTVQETRVLQLIATGKSNREIGADLWLAEQTIKFHASNIFRKMGVSNRCEAVWRGLELGIVQAPARISFTLIQCPLCDRRFDWPIT